MKMRVNQRYGPNMRDLYNPITREINLATFYKGKILGDSNYDTNPLTIGTSTVYYD